MTKTLYLRYLSRDYYEQALAKFEAVQKELVATGRLCSRKEYLAQLPQERRDELLKTVENPVVDTEQTKQEGCHDSVFAAMLEDGWIEPQYCDPEDYTDRDVFLNEIRPGCWCEYMYVLNERST